jgi:membrane protein DedA with SNARE-associated domain
MFHSFVNAISDSAWSYAIIFGVAALDGFFPLVPSETTVIAAGVLAASGDLRIELILPAAAAGAIVGDNVSFWVGRTLGERIAERLFSGSRRRQLDRAHRMIEERGGYLIVIARFIPGGRTAATFAAGSLDWAWLRFIKFDVAAGAIWGSYAGLLGYFGGRTFKDSPFKGFLVAFGIALAITAGVEVFRWFRKRAAAPPSG